MIITPYRVLFEVDLESDTGKYRYGRPTSEMLPVDFSEEDNAYLVKTHDRGNREGGGRYYQIAFRIEDPAPYTFEELELHIDSAIYRNDNGIIRNDLYCDPNDRGNDKNLWYQLSRYEVDRDGFWRIVNDTNKKALVVDCITSSGVFRVVPVRKGRVLTNVGMPWIYVLPSSVTIQNYHDMLSDLINLYDSLLINSRSTVGIGKTTAIEADTLRIKKEIEMTDELTNTIKAIISSPSELQRKEYVKMPLRKIHHYDSRVIREYIKYGSSGKTLGVTFFEDHDTYENRVIKYVLSRMQKLYSYQSKRTPSVPKDIERAVQEEYARRTAVITASKQIIRGSVRSFSFSYRAPIKDVPLEVKINGNQVSMPRHAPFSVAGWPYVKLSLKAESKRELAFFIKGLFATFSERLGSKFDVECTVLQTKKSITSGHNTVHELIIGKIRSVNGVQFKNNPKDISDAEYNAVIDNVCRESKYFKRSENDRFYKIPEIEKLVGIAREEELHMKAEIKADLLRKKENAIAFDSLLERTDQLTSLLNDSWFSEITELSELSDLRPSAKFLMNKHYSVVYRLITEMMADHSTLASSFDINAFGISKTELVYEYWVFYRLLYQLQSIGFSIQNQDSLINNYRAFIQGRADDSKYSNYSVIAKRRLGEREICIEIGYEKTFIGRDINGKELKRAPDYYLRLISNGESHWYFFDAKYKCFSKKDSSKVNYLQEIYDIALSRYIADMEQIFKTSNEMCGTKNYIQGTYIIMADIDDLPGELSVTNRLFGGVESILSEESLEQWDNRITTDLIDISTEHLPCHRYGAIHLTPDHVDELQSLLELIFEYLETEKKDDHPNLFYCWKCGSPEKANRQAKETSTSTNEIKYYKYYVTCPHCFAFRSDNHCRSCGKAIIKHTRGNFHKYDESVTSPQWAFLCPDCGSPVNGFPTIDESELDEMEKGGHKKRGFTPEVPDEYVPIDYGTYEEPPPLTEEELIALAPPEYFSESEVETDGLPF